jgi:hypothetical protein
MKEILRCDLQSVTFSKPSVKNVCSRHAGSILALDEPIVPPNPAIIEVAKNVFRAALEVSSSGSDNSSVKSTLSHVMIYDLLISAKLVSDKHEKGILIDLIIRIYIGPSDMDEKAFLDFITSFIAPAYYYGQRLRRNAGRGELIDFTELILRGCDANTGDGEGLTSLHYACEYDRVNIIDALEGLAGKTLIVNAEVISDFLIEILLSCLALLCCATITIYLHLPIFLFAIFYCSFCCFFSLQKWQSPLPLIKATFILFFTFKTIFIFSHSFIFTYI